jgi:hypothetical protein
MAEGNGSKFQFVNECRVFAPKGVVNCTNEISLACQRGVQHRMARGRHQLHTCSVLVHKDFGFDLTRRACRSTTKFGLRVEDCLWSLDVPALRDLLRSGRGTEMVPPFVGPVFPLVLGEKPLSLVR